MWNDLGENHIDSTQNLVVCYEFKYATVNNSFKDFGKMQVALKSDGSFQLSKRRAVLKIGVIFEIFILSGNELDDSDKL